MSAILTTVNDVAQLRLTDAQLSSFLHALSWHMGGSLDDVDAFVSELGAEASTLIAYWAKGNAIGSLTVSRPAEGSSGQPPISGWIRSLKKVQKLDLTADIRIDQLNPQEKDVRPGVRIYFRDLDEPIELSASQLPNQPARDAVGGFIAHLRKMIADGPAG